VLVTVFGLLSDKHLVATKHPPFQPLKHYISSLPMLILTNTGSDITLKHTWKDKSKSTDTTNNGFSLDYTYPRKKDGLFASAQQSLAQLMLEH
jgi:hypothetical protein